MILILVCLLKFCRFDVGIILRYIDMNDERFYYIQITPISWMIFSKSFCSEYLIKMDKWYTYTCENKLTEMKYNSYTAIYTFIIDRFA